MERSDEEKGVLAKKKEAEKKEGEEEAKEIPEINAEDLDVWEVKDVLDIGSGEPLFANFVYEDWALLSIRYELHLLVHSFVKDMDDPERTGFIEAHAAFYYNKYFKKAFNVKSFAVNDLSGLVALIKDTVKLDEKSQMMQTVLAADTPFENFVKLTEDHRRERQRRTDAGDETAQLKFSRPQPPPPKQPNYPPAGGRGPPMGGRRDDRGPPNRGGQPSVTYSAQKRTYTPAPASYPSAKYPRQGGSYGGGYPSYGRR